jgi:hypothetical protein
VHARVSLEHHRLGGAAVQACKSAALSPGSPTLAFHPLANGAQVADACYSAEQDQHVLTLILNLGLGPGLQ